MQSKKESSGERMIPCLGGSGLYTFSYPLRSVVFQDFRSLLGSPGGLPGSPGGGYPDLPSLKGKTLWGVFCCFYAILLALTKRQNTWEQFLFFGVSSAWLVASGVW